MSTAHQCATCDDGATELYLVESRGNFTIAELFPDADQNLGPAHPGLAAVPLCAECAMIASVLPGQSFGAVAEPEFRVVRSLAVFGVFVEPSTGA